MSIKSNIESARAALPPQVQLVAVSKTHPPELIQEAYDAGQRIFGENKVQEMVSKYEVLPKDIQWHLIGHLQTNKVKYIAPFVSLIHSVDSVKLAEEINKQGKKIGRTIPCLLQVHIAKEETKFGFSSDELLDFVKNFDTKKMEHIRIDGLMGMASLTDNVDQIKAEFQGLQDLFDRIATIENRSYMISMSELSMGMSSDYKIAIEAGSTMVRIGTAIFGKRDYSI